MISDAIHNASIPVASSNPKDFSKKKRGNRTAKLKQCKLDARREQWLSQVKLKGSCKNEMNGAWSTGGEKLGHVEKESVHILDKLEIKSRGDEEDGSSMHHCSDTDSSPSNSPTSFVSVSNHSGTNFTASSRSCSRTSSSRRSSISSNGCCWGTTSEGDVGDADDDGCLDDWEAVADALAVTDKMKQERDSALVSSPLNKHGNSAQSGSCLEVTVQGIGILNGDQESRGTVQRPPGNGRAWRADDAFRPQCLPNLSKQYSLPSNSERRVGFGGSAWGCQNGRPVPTSCPICFEDLDCTDSSFMPCLCGFRLCLFCHKRILEEDGRCPGCRKQYEHDLVDGETAFDGGCLTYRLARSCSMIARS